MRISEIFHSIQGEGILTGIPSVFIRTSGCNLRCWFCDTPYTSWEPEGESLSLDAILEKTDQFVCDHVVVTGGEPLMMAEIEDLCSRLKARKYHITMETAATIFKPIECDLLSLSPKLASSTPWDRDPEWAKKHEQLRLQPDVIRRFVQQGDYQLKFVVDQPEDVQEILTLLEKVPEIERSRVLLMPQGLSAKEVQERGQWVVEECKRHQFRYCPRLHIDLFGLQRGT